MRLITKPIVDLPCSRIVVLLGVRKYIFLLLNALHSCLLLVNAIYFTALPEVNLITLRRHAETCLMIIGCHFL